MDLGKRILIMGSSCSGKSAIATSLSDLLGFPVVHLDKISVTYLKSGVYSGAWDMMNEEICIAANQPMWIIDGNFSATRDYRLERADTIIYLDFNRYICLLRLFIRRIKNFKQPQYIKNGCPEKLSIGMIKKIWSYPRESRDEMIMWLSKINPSKKVYCLNGNKAVKKFLNEVQQK